MEIPTSLEITEKEHWNQKSLLYYLLLNTGTPLDRRHSSAVWSKMIEVGSGDDNVGKQWGLSYLLAGLVWGTRVLETEKWPKPVALDSTVLWWQRMSSSQLTAAGRSEEMYRVSSSYVGNKPGWLEIYVKWELAREEPGWLFKCKWRVQAGQWVEGKLKKFYHQWMENSRKFQEGGKSWK